MKAENEREIRTFLGMRRRGGGMEEKGDVRGW